MRTTFLPLLCLLLSACVGRESHYQVLDERYRVEGTVCGGVPYSQARIPLSEDISGLIALRDQEESVEFSIQVALSRNQTVQFDTSALVLATDDHVAEAQLEQWSVSVLGRDGKAGHLEHFGTTEELRGLGRNEELATAQMPYLRKDTFTATARFMVKPPDAVTLKLPSLRVNGRRHVVDPAQFTRVDKTAVYGCIQ